MGYAGVAFAIALMFFAASWQNIETTRAIAQACASLPDRAECIKDFRR